MVGHGPPFVPSNFKTGRYVGREEKRDPIRNIFNIHPLRCFQFVTFTLNTRTEGGLGLSRK